MSRRTVFEAVASIAILVVLGCYLETSASSMSNSETLPNAEGLEFLIQQQFALKVKHASVAVDCPSGLSGAAGRSIMCNGRTSDGYLLEIEVQEKGDGAFGWLVVQSRPVGSSAAEPPIR